MKCGAKRYIVNLIKNGEPMVLEVMARSPIAARKVIYSQHANEAIEIKSVQLKNA